MRKSYLLVLFLLFSCCFGSAQTAQSEQTSSENGRKVLRQLTPSYPPLAKKMGLGGTVKVVAVVAPDGGVKSVEPKGGSPVLLKAAEEAVAKWKFASGGESREIIEVHFAP